MRLSFLIHFRLCLLYLLSVGILLLFCAQLLILSDDILNQVLTFFIPFFSLRPDLNCGIWLILVFSRGKQRVKIGLLIGRQTVAGVGIYVECFHVVPVDYAIRYTCPVFPSVILKHLSVEVFSESSV